MIQGYLIAGIAGLALSVGAYLYGRHDGKQIEEARQLAEQAIVEKARDAMLRAAAEAIAGIDVVNKTIRQEVQREIVEKPVYRDCRADPGIVRAINAAKTGRPEPPGDSELSGTSSPAG